MNCKIEEKKIQEITTGNIVQQTSFWARIKYQQGMQPYAFEYSATDDVLFPSMNGTGYIRDDLLVLVRPVDKNHCIAYVPYGPVDEPDFENQGVFLEELSEVLKSYLPKNCIMIRYDLPWENQWAQEEDFFDENGNWKGPPSFKQQEFRVNFKTQNWNLLKSPSDNLPSNTIFLDLKLNDGDLLKKMKPKTRYNIRVSKRKGIRVENYGLDKLDTWYSLYKETARRNNITLHPKKNFFSVLEYQKANKIDTHLLMADFEGEFVAAMFLILSKKRGTYLYGASSDKYRNLMATYAVQWEGIRIAQQSGCEEYDMFGVAPNADSSHPLNGLYRFKSGFGGKIFHRMGCWDYPLNKQEYMSFRAQEVNHPGYHVH